jgi:hypothetical protein
MKDYEIREAICNYMDELFSDKYRIMDELVIGKARADIVIVEKELTGYEIKGDTDSFARLPGQIKEYDRYFQKNYLVVGVSHGKTAEKHIPHYWGIICVSEKNNDIKRIETVREAVQSPKFSQKKQLSLLWRRELINILRANGLLKCSGKTKAYICGYLLKSISPRVLQKQTCKELLERDYTL